MRFQYPYHHLNPLEYVEIFQDPLWYLKLEKELLEYFWGYTGEDRDQRPPVWHEKRKEWVTMTSELLENNAITLGESGGDWDQDRLPIDTVIVHHTSTPPDVSLFFLDALSLLRLHSFYCAKVGEPEYRQPVWSNHFYQGRQTFIPYHYLIRRDGTFKQVLEDRHIGWDCGNRSFYNRGIAISFVDELENARPSQKAIESTRSIISWYNPRHILGHREIKGDRTCPGNLFLGDHGWKKELLILKFLKRH